MHIGVDYYPEHWRRARWETDARLMQAAGFNVVRLFEFAWVFMEPEEGRFDFELADEALAVLRRRGIRAVLGTPTAAMPAWVPRKYPEVMATDKQGRRLVWGVRKNNCFTSGAYRLLAARITQAMAEHFARTPNVIGWQTDNEFGHPFCHCDSCRAEFQRWLRVRYGTLAALNAAWGTHFWGQRYGVWDEIPVPDDPGTHNPGLCLDWQRFFSWLNVRFQADQIRILRRACPRHFITHNLMGLFCELDYYDLAADLDHVSWDNYPVWGKVETPYSAAAAADLMRGLKKKNFWIMEQTAGPGGWSTFGRNPRPGEIRKIAYQQLAHGSDAQIWFRWRTCTAGREQYWHGLLGHDGRPLRRYREAARTAREFHRLAGSLAGTTVKSRVAIVYDYDSIWALRIQPAFGGNTYHEDMLRYYAALFRQGVNADMIKPDDDFRRYRVLIAPQLYILPDAVAGRLDEFVRRGGVLLTDLRTGVKNATGLCHERTLPGRLSPALGIAIEEYEALAEGEAYALRGRGACAGAWSALRYADWIAPKGAETLLGYEAWHMRKFAAATRHRYGRGTGYYVGTIFKEPQLYDLLIAEVLRRGRVAAPVTPPAGVEASVREDRGRKLLFLLNHTEAPQTVNVPAGCRELLSGRSTGKTLTLDLFGVAVVRL
jgi:beta-galactosidase